MNRQYIGARYVPKFYEGSNGNEWDSNTSYEALTIVTYNNATYTSKIPVPTEIGNPADNSSYWIKTADYNAQMEEIIELVNEKTSDEYIGNIVEEQIESKGVNTWFADNESNGTSSYSPALIPFRQITRKLFNCSVEMLVDKWDTCRTITEQATINYTDDYSGFDVTMLNGGLKLRNTQSARANMSINGIMKIRSNACYKFKTDILPSSNTTYGRLGLGFDGKIIIYFNNDTKQFYYESNASSLTPTPISEDTFDEGTVEVMCCVKINGNGIKVFVRRQNENWSHLGDVDCSGSMIGGNAGTFARLDQNTAYMSIYDIKCVYTFMTIADTRYIHYDDTTPFIVNNKAYLVATLQISAGVNFTGILRHTIGYDDFELVSIVKITGQEISMGSEILFDRKSKQFICMFRHYVSEFDTRIYIAKANNNNLNGELFFDVEPMLEETTESTTFGSMQNDEDPVCCKFGGHWYVAINRAPNENSDYFYYEIFRSTDEEFDVTKFEHWYTVNGNLTGGSFIAIGNKLYFVCGNGSNITSFDVLNKTIDGNIGVTVDNRVWGNITGVVRGNKVRYFITTFDRHNYTDDPEALWSYGDLVMFESTQVYSQDSINNTYGVK